MNAGMKKNELWSGVCESYTHDGMGVVKKDGFPFFVKGLLRGEKAMIRTVKLKKTYGFGKVEELLDESAARAIPPCPLAGRCGGCQLQHMSYPEQLAFKRQKVQDVITRIAGLDLEVLPVIGMDTPYFYRNKAQIPVGIVKGETVSGFYRINSNDIVDMEECCIQSHLINKVYGTVRAHLQEDQEMAAQLRHVLIKHAFARDEIMVVLITREMKSARWKQLAETLIEVHPQIKGVVQNINQRKDNVILGEKEILLAGRPYIEDEIDGFTFRISSKSFYQVNPIQTRVLYEQALACCGLSGDEQVLDLYCGVGTISMFLARHAAKVTGIEIVPDAIRNAKENAARNAFDNLEFICSDAAAYADRLAAEGSKPDVICVDPPRKGCAKSVLEDIARMAPQRIVYVSCDPGTLARDLRILDELGYETVSVQPVDMFPQTSGVETVVLLSKLNTKQHIEVELNLDELDLTAAESQATYEEIKAYVLEHTGLKVSHLYIAQVKQKYGIIERENYNKPKSENSRQPKCPLEKEAAITEVLKYFGMI